MELFDFTKRPSMLEEVRECLSSENGILLDVRTPDEYGVGHIPGSVNVPVSRIAEAEKLIRSKDSPVCVYCRSGARAETAAAFLRRRGYTNVRNLGGIKKYNGKIER